MTVVPSDCVNTDVECYSISDITSENVLAKVRCEVHCSPKIKKGMCRLTENPSKCASKGKLAGYTMFVADTHNMALSIHVSFAGGEDSYVTEGDSCPKAIDGGDVPPLSGEEVDDLMPFGESVHTDDVGVARCRRNRCDGACMVSLDDLVDVPSVTERAEFEWTGER